MADKPKKDFKIDPSYNEVAARIIEFREKFPEGSLQQVSMSFENIGPAHYIVYTAAAYRTPDDPRPGIGTAWEPIPGKTPYTRDSEVQNAETAAWGRALIAVGAADAKKGIASADEMRPREAEQAEASKPRSGEYKRLRREADDARKKVDEAALRDVWDETTVSSGDGVLSPYESDLLFKHIKVLRSEIRRATNQLFETGADQ